MCKQKEMTEGARSLRIADSVGADILAAHVDNLSDDNFTDGSRRKWEELDIASAIHIGYLETRLFVLIDLVADKNRELEEITAQRDELKTTIDMIYLGTEHPRVSICPVDALHKTSERDDGYFVCDECGTVLLSAGITVTHLCENALPCEIVVRDDFSKPSELQVLDEVRVLVEDGHELPVVEDDDEPPAAPDTIDAELVFDEMLDSE